MRAGLVDPKFILPELTAEFKDMIENVDRQADNEPLNESHIDLTLEPLEQESITSTVVKLDPLLPSREFDLSAMLSNCAISYQSILMPLLESSQIEVTKSNINNSQHKSVLGPKAFAFPPNPPTQQA